MKRILITGAIGQIGSELTPALRQRYGAEQVAAVGHHTKPAELFRSGRPYVSCDVKDQTALDEIIRQFNIDTIYHLAARLSALTYENIRHSFRKLWLTNRRGSEHHQLFSFRSKWLIKSFIVGDKL